MNTAVPAPSGVAVVITTYDHAAFLAAAIESVLAQSVAPDEIIVVDDGSHDHPEDVVDRFCEVRLIRQDNAGLAAARNTGWQAASAERVVFLDADDRLRPEALEVNLARLAGRADAAFSYGAYVTVDATSASVKPVELRHADDGFQSFLEGNMIGMHGAVMYRRSVLAELGGFTTALPACEDYDLYLRVSARFPVVHGPEVLAEYWHHEGNMSRDSAVMLRSALHVLRSQHAEARRVAALPAYRRGVLGWKRYYAETWWRNVHRALRARRLDRRLLRQGLSLAALAPATLVAMPVRVLCAEVATAARRRRRRGAGVQDGAAA